MVVTMTAAVLVTNSRPGVVQTTLASPTTGNAMSPGMVDSMVTALERAEADPAARVFVVTAQGKTFCAGMPLGDPTSKEWALDPMPVRTLLDRLARSPLITVAVVDGAAVGGGVGLAAACDQVLLGPHGSFQLTEVLLGLLPAIVLPVIAKRVGAHRAFSMALTAERFEPLEAIRIGLADRAGQDPQRELRRLLVRLRRADATALTALKRYHTALHPAPAGWDALISTALRERLDDPQVRHRLTALHQEELIP
jgi:polyketide biosynthesis enoyl-CoA hydratase PksH